MGNQNNRIENMEIPMKDINLIGKIVYNTKVDKRGIITGVCLENHLNKIGYSFRVYYDRIEKDATIFAQDFYNGDLKFLIITEYEYKIPELDKVKEKEIEEIKKFMGNKFSSNTIMYITEKEYKKKGVEQEYRGIVEITGKFKELDSLAADVVQENYSMLKYFCLFGDGIITENQMLYGFVNVLSSELRVQRDRNLEKQSKTLRDTIKEICQDGMRKKI